MQWWHFVLIAYALMSAFTFVLYAIDKMQAKRAKSRVAESTLHLAELLGGWPGGLLAMRFLHHKNKKTSFLVIFGLVVFFHLLGWSVWLWFTWQKNA